MNLHENKEDFTEAVQAVSRGLNISPALVEKDYYVTLLLKELSEKEFLRVVLRFPNVIRQSTGFRKI